MYKIYDKTGRLVVDIENDYFDVNHITIDEWRQIFQTNFKQMTITNKAGEVVVSIGDN